MPKRAVLSCLLLFSLSALCFAGRDAWCLAPGYRQSFKKQLLFIVDKHPPYRLGGAEDLSKGLDCSGYVYLAARWAGIPGVSRTTSLRMAQGLGGWSGRDVAPAQGSDCDLLFWTFNPGRPFSHVGVLILDAAGNKRTAHASPRLGVVLKPLKGSLKQNLTKVRRLTIGE